MARQSIRQSLLFVLAAASIAVGSDAARAACGSVVSLPAHDGTTQNYSLAGDAKTAKAALVLLVGGGGHIAMDDGGCATKLKGNSLIRQRDAFHAGGMVTALLDAPSDHHEQDGLGGFRLDPRHADDIGKVIADVRAKTGLPVWVAGTSRGTISAANAASRLSGAAAPDGVILTSPLTKGFAGGRKPWVAQDVFKLDLSAIKAPLLVIVQERDTCIRTPPELGAKIVEDAGSVRKQSVVVTGGPDWSGTKGEACQGRSPHGFIDQWDDVAAGMVRFVNGGAY